MRLNSKAVMNEQVQDKAKALAKALGKQFELDLGNLVFAGFNELGDVRIAMFPVNPEKLNPLSLIEIGNYLSAKGLELELKRRNK